MRIHDHLSTAVASLPFAFMCVGFLAVGFCDGGGRRDTAKSVIQLPDPHTESDVSVEKAISSRRSKRDFKDKPIGMQQVAQLMWSAQGITGQRGRKRAAPSAGATYPMVVFVAVGENGVGGIPAGVYRYVPEKHALKEIRSGDVRGGVAEAALGQNFIAEAPVDIILGANYRRTARRYGERAKRYVRMEAGHVSQNIYLQAETLGLGTVSVGAFEDDELSEVCDLPDNVAPLYVMPVGHAR